MIKPAERINAPCCGVFAAHLAVEEPDFDVTFDSARKKLGRTRGWQGRMYWAELKDLLSLFGIQYEVSDRTVGVTIGAAHKAGLFADDRQHVISISGHFLTIRNGLAYDQAFPVGIPVERYPHRRCRVKYVVKIL